MSSPAFTLVREEPVSIPAPPDTASREQLMEFAAVAGFAHAVGLCVISRRIANAYLARWHQAVPPNPQGEAKERNPLVPEDGR